MNERVKIKELTGNVLVVETESLPSKVNDSLKEKLESLGFFVVMVCH